MSDFDSALDLFAQQFKSWRQNRTYVNYPEYFWDEICKLAKNIPVSTIAKALGVNVNYLKLKVKKLTKPVTFTPVQISYQKLSSIEFQDKNNKTIIIKFQADTQELVRLIQLLS